MSNQYLICLLSPDADRQSALTIVFDMIWKLEESPIIFQVGMPGDTNAKYMHFQASISSFLISLRKVLDRCVIDHRYKLG